MMLRTLFCLALSTSLVSSDNCVGRCNLSADNAYSCQCNYSCIKYGDCCSDYSTECNDGYTCQNSDCVNEYHPTRPCQCNNECVNFGNCCADRDEVCFGNGGGSTSSSCSGRCGASHDNSMSCQCNTACETYGDCCSDYQSICQGVTTISPAESCSGRCGASHDNTMSCQCNTACETYGDCCSDYLSVCQGGSGGTGSCGKISASDEELRSISLQMWNANTNNFPYGEGYLTYDIQSQTTTSATNDVAPNPFFTYVNEQLFQGDTYQKLKALQDNYFREQGYTEVVTNEELQENDMFLDAVLATDVGTILYNFLDSKNLAGCAGLEGFKTILNDIWFGMYDRKAPRDTSGFEHAFVGEIKGSGVSGFHNWMYFYEQEKAGTFNYQGWINNQEPRLVGMRHTWEGATKPMNGFTIGTSPEIEFALFSLCHLARPGGRCPIKMADEGGNPLERYIQTYSWSGSYPPNGQSYIASAYFIS